MSPSVELPPRPAIPPLFVLLAVFIALSRCLLEAPRLPAYLPVCALIVLLIAAVLGGVMILKGYSLAAFICGLMLMCAASSVLCVSFSEGIETSANILSSRTVSKFEFVLETDVSTGRFDESARAVAYLDGLAVGRVVIRAERLDSDAGVVRGFGRFEPYDSDDEWEVQARSQGFCGCVRLVRIDAVGETAGRLGPISSFRRQALNIIQPERSRTRALCAGLSCANREQLRLQGVSADMADLGLAHLIAVSGSHLALLSELARKLLLRSHTSIRLSSFGTIVILLAYVLVCGAPLSAVRAWLMCSSSLIGKCMGRRGHGLSSLSFAALVMCFYDLSCVTNLGFLFSFLSVVGLCLFEPYLRYVGRVIFTSSHAHLRLAPTAFRRIVRMILRALLASASASLTCQLICLPLSVEAFSSVSLVGVISQLLLSIPFSLCASLCIVFDLVLIVPVVGALLASAWLILCDVAAAFVLLLCDLLLTIPVNSLALDSLGPYAPLIWFGAAVLLLWLWPPVSRRVLGSIAVSVVFVTACVFVSWRFFAPARLCVLDVGQGDAILIQEGAHAILIDTGPDASVALALLRKRVFHLDAVVLTHLHSDHIAGLKELKGHVSIDRVVVAQGILKSDQTQQARQAHTSSQVLTQLKEGCVAPFTELAYGQELVCENFTLRCVWPQIAVDGLHNDQSLCLGLSYDDGESRFSALLMGDAESDVLSRIVAQEQIESAHVIKLGHHGSELSVSADLLKQLNVSLALASAGKNNSFGHPTKACKDAVAAAGALFVCTSESGDIELYCDKKTLSIIAPHARAVVPRRQAKMMGKMYINPIKSCWLINLAYALIE